MEKLNITDNKLIITPDFVGINESGKINVLLYGVGASLTGFALWTISPSNQLTEITPYLKIAPVVFPFLQIYEATYTFSENGRFKFILHDTATDDLFIDSTDVAAWVSKLDLPISEVAKQRTDIQRIFAKIRSS